MSTVMENIGETPMNDVDRLVRTSLHVAEKDDQQLSAKSAGRCIPYDSVDKSLTMPQLPEDPALCKEELEIAVLPPVDMAQWIQLRRNLLRVPYLTILCTSGSLRTGALFTVAVSQKELLLDMLMQMSGVEEVELGVSEKVLRNDDYWSPLNQTYQSEDAGCQRERVFVTFKR